MQTLELKNVLNNVSKLEASDLEQFLLDVSVLLARKKAPSLPKKESDLLKKINNSLPETTRIRYRSLRKKQQQNNLSIDERTELLNLVTIVENADIERLKAMIELSQIKEVSLDDLIKELELFDANAIL